jgi:hypothetical protein
VLIVELGSAAFHLSKGGLEGKYWASSLAFRVGSLPLQYFRKSLICDMTSASVTGVGAIRVDSKRTMQ